MLLSKTGRLVKFISIHTILAKIFIKEVSFSKFIPSNTLDRCKFILNFKIVNHVIAVII